MRDPLAESVLPDTLPANAGGVKAEMEAEAANQEAANKNLRAVIQAQIEHVDFCVLEKLRRQYPVIDRLIVERDELAAFKESLENDTKPKGAARRN